MNNSAYSMKTSEQRWVGAGPPGSCLSWVICRGIHTHGQSGGHHAPEEITKPLQLASKGDKSAAHDLMKTIEKELRKIASLHMRRERPNHTLQTIAVVIENLLENLHQAYENRKQTME